MGREQQLHSNRNRKEKLEEFSGDHHGGISIDYEEMISPVSLLRSDRFARTKPANIARREQSLNGDSEPSGDDANKKSVLSSPVMRENTQRTRNATVRRDNLGLAEICKISSTTNKERAKAPGTVTRPRAGPASARCTRTPGNDLQLNHQNVENKDHNSQPSSQMSERHLILNSAALGAKHESSILPQTMSRMSLSPLVGRENKDGDFKRPQISLSPLRPSSAPSITRSEAHWRPYAKPSPTRPAWMVTQNSELDAWTERCLNLKQQIAEHLSTCSLTSTNDRQTCESRFASTLNYQRTTSNAKDMSEHGQQILQNTAIVRGTFSAEQDRPDEDTYVKKQASMFLVLEGIPPAATHPPS